MVTTGVLARIPERIEALIYLDAFMPEDGKALVDYLPPEMVSAWESLKDKDLPLPPMPLSALGVTDPQLVAFIAARLAMQPWRTVFQPVKALKPRPDIPVSMIVCTGFGPSPFTARLAEMEADPAVRLTTIDASHLCMLTDVDTTMAALLGN